VLHGAEVINVLLQIFSNAQYRVDVCGNSKFLTKIFSYSVVDKVRLDACKRKCLRQRYIFEITKDNISYCKGLTRVTELRHLDENESNFITNENECLGFITMQEESLQATYSNIREVVEQQQSVFETFWDKAFPAQNKIREIEEGLKSEYLEVISDHKKATDIYLDLARDIKKEALLLFANSKAITRADRLGVLDCLIDASKSKGAVVKIISPITEDNSLIIEQIYEKAPNIKILNGGSSHSGLFIVDSKRFIRFELKEPKAEEFSDAVGFIEHSNSKVGVYSAKSFFELLWNERLQYEKLEEADKIKSEFINIAAHELRTPVQPIISLSQVLQSRIKDTKQQELLDIIVRNAKRLQRLTEDILEVTKIEGHSLNLKKEHFNLTELISNTIQDVSSQSQKANNEKLKFVFYKHDCKNNNQRIIIDGDKAKIGQVLLNLLTNAIKFTEEGTISINVQAGKESDDNGVITVTVKDTGDGIDSEVMPRLFTKFASKCSEGTGLGLYISKSIVEAHGGKIWGENNNSGGDNAVQNRGRGATFHFTLPVVNDLSSSASHHDKQQRQDDNNNQWRRI
jgi:two-component system, OmpR family, sensor histidine kinase VicK